MYIVIVCVGHRDAGDGATSLTEPGEDDVRTSSQQVPVIELCCHETSTSRQRPRTINYPQDSTTGDPGETDRLTLTKSLSGGDLSGSGDRRTTQAAPLTTSESTSRLFSPFPRQHVNKRRVDNAIRLGLYTVDDTAGTQKTATGRSARYPHS